MIKKMKEAHGETIAAEVKKIETVVLEKDAVIVKMEYVNVLTKHNSTRHRIQRV